MCIRTRSAGMLLKRVVERLDLKRGVAQELGVVDITEADMAAHGEIGRVDLENETGSDDRLVLGRHCVSDRFE